MRTIPLLSGRRIPVLGQGTWRMGEDARRHADEVAVLRLGLDLGLSLIDTAEMYADGGAERIVGEAIVGRRAEVFLVSKVLPSNASTKGTIAACERSLRRLKVDSLDLYLIHWRGGVPLAQTLEGFARLIEAGKIASWGVSNFDVADMDELAALPGGAGCAANQVLYNLSTRGVEFDLLPWCEARAMPVMAYSPVAQGRVLSHPVLRAVAARLGATPAQVALAGVLRKDGVCAIPMTSSRTHVRENLAALDLALGSADRGELDRAFPPPARKRPLAML